MSYRKVAFVFACVFTLTFVQTTVGATPEAALAATVKLDTVSVNLPAGNRPFPPGPNVNLVNANCVTCHSSGMILNQPHLTTSAWQGEVTKMINVYKAPIDPANVPAIVAYLAAVKGG